MKIPYEIIIVDNASSDGTKEIVPTLDARINFISSNVNLGFSAGNNVGFLEARGSTVLLLNPDAKLINEDLDKALRFLREHPNTILGPKILNPDLSLQNSVLQVPTFFSLMLETFFLSYLSRPKSLAEIQTGIFALSGACLLLNAEVYKKLQGFDEDLFWMDDVDLCVRAQRLGYNCSYFPEWSVVHTIGQSSKSNFKVVIANQLISKIKYFRKHDEVVNYVAAVVFTQIHILLRILLFLVLSPFGGIFRLKFYAYCFAQKLFFRHIFTDQKQLV